MIGMLALVDCNSFFASCETIFRPDLRGKAVVVLSNNDGIVVARSPEAKRLGIPMGEAAFNIKRFIESGVVKVFSSNYRLYSDMSWRVMKTLEQWTPNIEVYSVDEAFLDFTGTRVDNPEALGQEIITTVKQWTGIPVSIGFAPTKTLCKVANETAKSRGTGICSLMDENARLTVLKQFDIGEVWGVGRRLAPRFLRLGLKTAYDLSMVDPLWIRKNFSIVQEQTVRELRGEPCFDLDSAPEPKKSIQISRSFGKATDRLEDLEEAVATFAARAAEKTRAQGSAASAVYVHINTSWYKNADANYYSQGMMTGFRVPTASTMEIIEVALDTLRKIYKPGRQYKKATVILHELKNAETVQSQGFLFEKNEERNADRRATEQKVMATLDRINIQHGKGTVFFGAEGVKKDWRSRQDVISPCYTTSLDELPVAR
jgi:DNA polymerase V